MIVSLFDYGTGNLHSLRKCLEAQGARVRVDADAADVLRADALVLPGVGAFGAAAEKLSAARPALVEALEAGFPCLGICLGMQLLFAASDESPGSGLGFIAGDVRRLRAGRLPHMGWNDVEVPGGADADPLFAGTADLVTYYANSYAARPEDPDNVIGWTTYETDRFAAAVRRKRAWGVQFHPEKSASAGLRVVANFLAEATP